MRMPLPEQGGLLLFERAFASLSLRGCGGLQGNYLAINEATEPRFLRVHLARYSYDMELSGEGVRW